MNFNNNGIADRNNNEENESEFDISDFDDFGKDLDNAAKDSLNQQHQQSIPAKNLYIDLLEDFILTYLRGLYFTKIKNIIQEKKKSIVIDYNHIIGFSDQLSEYLLTDPKGFINTFKDVLYFIDKEQNLDYFNENQYFNIRLTNYPIREKIKNIDVDQRNRLLCMRGNISKTSDKKPYIWRYCLRCPDCDNEIYSDYDEKDCSNCDKHPQMKKDKNKHIYTNVVFIKIQELSEDLEGRTPQAIDCMAMGDIIDEIKPGIKGNYNRICFIKRKYQIDEQENAFFSIGPDKQY